MPSSSPRVASGALLLLAALQLSAHVALAGKLRLGGPEAGQATSPAAFRLDSEDICGAPEVWRRLTDDPSVAGVQNINWQKIDKIIEDRLAVKSQEIAALGAEIKGLESRIAEKKKSEEARAMPLEAVTRLISVSLGAFGGQGSKGGALEAAQQSGCGKPGGQRRRVPRHAHRESREAFEAAAGEYFKEKIRCNGEDFLAECGRLLLPAPAGGESGEESYCPQLCQFFKDTAQDLSDRVAGETAGRGSEDLVKELQEKSEDQAAAKAAWSTCQRARDFITGFRKQITRQKEEIEGRFGEYQVAEENLDDALWDLEDLKELLGQEQEALAAAETSLQESGADVAAAQRSLKALQGEEATLLTQLSDLAATMEATKSKLNAAKEADRVAIQLRSAVSATTMKMRMLFEKQVLEPLNDVGLGSSAKTEEYMEQDIEELAAAAELREQLQSLAGYCQGDAKKAFAAVRHQVNLEGFCDFEAPSAVFSELSGAVRDRRQAVRSEIEELQSWADPLKGQTGLTPAQVEGFVDQGEPEGLRAIVGVFSGTGVYKDYLKDWQLEGKFLGLLAQLRGVVSSTDASFTALGSDLEALQGQIDSVVDKRKEAQKELAAAEAQQGIDAKSKAALAETVSGLAAKAGALADDRSRLEEEVRKAKERWDESKEALVKAHKAATSFLESRAGGRAFDLSEAAVLQAEQQLARTVKVLRGAEASFKAVQAKITAAERGR